MGEGKDMLMRRSGRCGGYIFVVLARNIERGIRCAASVYGPRERHRRGESIGEHTQ